MHPLITLVRIPEAQRRRLAPSTEEPAWPPPSTNAVAGWDNRPSWDNWSRR
jgi:hypothetical protein